MRYLLSFVVVFCLLQQSSRATHLVGGEIFYEYLGNDNYGITLIVYRDCGPANANNTQFDSNVALGIFDLQNDFLVESVNIQLFSSNIEQVPVELENPCFILPPDLCVERATYYEVVNLPPNPNGYYVIHQRCCRNPSIDNLVNPNATGVTLYTEIPGTNLVGQEFNNSARFDNFPPAALCAFAEFFFDHGATDLDGDSLVYEFCTPFHSGTSDPVPPLTPAPYIEVTWDNGFSESYQIDSNPSFAINPETGYITGTATQMGQYVLGVCVYEYRDGLLINRSHRDFQFNVTLCDPNIIASIPEQESFCDGLTVSFDNISTNATFFQWDFGVEGIDTDISTLIDPTYTYAEPGLYNVRLIANPGWTCADTAFSLFDARPPLDIAIELGESECEYPNMKYDFSVTTNGNENAIYSWNFGPGSSPSSSTSSNPQDIILFEEQQSYQISLSVEDNGCFASDAIVVENPPNPIAIINPQESFCAGLTYTFSNSSQNNTSVIWNFGTTAINDVSFEMSPEFTFPDTGAYVIELVALAPNSCPDTTSLNFEIFDFLNPAFNEQEPQCLSTNSFDFAGYGNSIPEAVFSWNFGEAANVSSTDNQNPQNIVFSEAGIYPVTLSISENGCTKTYTADVWVITDPNFSPVINSNPGCAPLISSYAADFVADTPMFFEWDFGDGNESNNVAGTHIYSNAGVYDITVLGYTTTGCVREISYILEDAITVNPSPIASFEMIGEDLDILNPTVQIINTSEEAVSCVYVTSDGTEINDCDFTYSFTEGGYQSITQTVTNEFGCAASQTGKVFIDGFVFYAPNSFSPNDDGLNDYWLPVMTGITEYSCKIYDRWGTLIFSSNDPNKAWIGDVRGGENYATTGIYQFDIVFNDSAGLSRRKQGHICLFR